MYTCSQRHNTLDLCSCRCRRCARGGQRDVSLEAYRFLRVATADSKPPSESKQDPSAIKGIRGDIRKTSCYPAHIPLPRTAGNRMSLACRHSWKTHADPGSSIFHPCYGNIDIGRRAADIGYVMMQLKQVPFYYYWQKCVPPPSHFRRQI